MAKFSRRHWIALTLLGAGVLMVIWGFRAQGRPRTELEDNIASCVWGVGIALAASGVTLCFKRLARPAFVIPIAVISPFAVFAFMVILLWAWIILNAALRPSPFANVSSGYLLIPEAKQIDDLCGPAWHFTANQRSPRTVEWFTEAEIGGRYELTMFVPVEFDRSTGDITRVAGNASFFLREVASVQGRGVSYGRQYEFSAEEWQKVVAADGDFSTIGIILDLNKPVAGFAEYQNRPRNGFQLKTGKHQELTE